MAKKDKASYILIELEWLETQIKVLKDQVEAMLANLEDRYGPRALPNGKIVEALISSKEDQIKTAATIMEKIPKMLQALDELRSREEAKLETRGNVAISTQAEEFLKNRNAGG